jgi:hypothetical protein
MPGRVRVHLVALAVAYQAAGQTADAIPLSERTLVDWERVLTLDHPSTRGPATTLPLPTGLVGVPVDAEALGTDVNIID